MSAHCSTVPFDFFAFHETILRNHISIASSLFRICFRIGQTSHPHILDGLNITPRALLLVWMEVNSFVNTVFIPWRLIFAFAIIDEISVFFFQTHGIKVLKLIPFIAFISVDKHVDLWTLIVLTDGFSFVLLISNSNPRSKYSSTVLRSV